MAVCCNQRECDVPSITNTCMISELVLVSFLTVPFSPFPLSIAECCSTPYSLLGLVFTVSFVALGVLTLCKFYLQGYRAFMNDNTMHRSVRCPPSCLLIQPL